VVNLLYYSCAGKLTIDRVSNSKIRRARWIDDEPEHKQLAGLGITIMHYVAMKFTQPDTSYCNPSLIGKMISYTLSLLVLERLYFSTYFASLTVFNAGACAAPPTGAVLVAVPTGAAVALCGVVALPGPLVTP
jgi:hypothetical protein